NPPPLAGEGREGACRHFYSRDIGRIWRVAEGLEYGIVGINEGIISAKSTGEIAPFGGMKESGNDRCRLPGHPLPGRPLWPRLPAQRNQRPDCVWDCTRR